MESAYFYLALSGMLTILLWMPYILARVLTWGLPGFLRNYPNDHTFPAEQPEPPLWASRAQRTHLNMVETMPAFIAVVIAASQLAPESHATISLWTQVFFFSRLGHAAVYIASIPYLRTPVYLLSWLAVIVIGLQILNR